MKYMGNETDFLSKIKNSKEAIFTDTKSSNSTIIIAFGGMKGNLGIPVFEFFKILSPLDTKKMFIRDLDQNLYFGGLPGITDSIDGIGDHLKYKFEELGIKRVVVLGNSAGANAAVLFGILLNAEKVVAFSPKTFITPLKRILFWDHQWWENHIRVYFTKGVKSEYWDLKKLLSKSDIKTKFQLHYSLHNRIDSMHCERMSKCPNVTIKGYEYKGHDLVRHLKETGELQKIITHILD